MNAGGSLNLKPRIALLLGQTVVAFPRGAGTGAIVFRLPVSDSLLETPELPLPRDGFPLLRANLLAPRGLDSRLRAERIVVGRHDGFLVREQRVGGRRAGGKKGRQTNDEGEKDERDTHYGLLSAATAVGERTA